MDPSDNDEKLQVIIDAVPSWIAYVDADRRYRLVNEAYRAHLVPRIADARGRTMAEVLGAAAYELIRHHVDRALDGEPVAFEIRTPDLGAGPRWLQAHYVPHRAPDGGVRGFVSQIQDVTPQKQVERRLSILADASRAIAAPIDHASTLAAVAGALVPALADWAIVFLARDDGELGPAELAPANDAVGKIARALTPDDDWEHPVVRAIRHGEPATLPLERLLDHQLAAVCGLRTAAIGIAPLVARGRSFGAIVIGSARTVRYEAEDLALLEELGRRAGAALDTAQLFDAERRINERLTDAVARQREADRRKDEFLAILGHELRNPLAPIITALDLMAMSGGHAYARERDVIRRQADHMTRLVDDLLDVSRLTREKIQLRTAPLEVWTAVAQAIETVSPLLEQRRHRLDVDVPREGLIVDADPIRLSQILSNLMTNAAKYTEPGGRIAVRATRDGEAIAIAIEDNGNGITQGLLPHVFEPFVQSDRTIDRAQGGLGLGLALVRSLTQLHGGTVVAHSDGPGTGSRFEVRLPAPTAVICEPVDDITSPVPRPVAGAAGRVLVVDDNADAADTLADVLRGVGYEVVVAHDAPEALHVAARFCPAIALLDIGLPVMDGYELARHLRAVLTQPPRLVAVTGYGHETDIVRSRAAGFEVHLGKPVSFDTLVKVLGDLQPASRDVS